MGPCTLSSHVLCRLAQLLRLNASYLLNGDALYFSVTSMLFLHSGIRFRRVKFTCLGLMARLESNTVSLMKASTAAALLYLFPWFCDSVASQHACRLSQHRKTIHILIVYKFSHVARSGFVSLSGIKTISFRRQYNQTQPVVLLTSALLVRTNY